MSGDPARSGRSVCARTALPLWLSRLPTSPREGPGTPSILLPLPGPPRGAPPAAAKLPEPAPAHSAIPGGWHHTRRERGAGPASADGHHLGWPLGAGWQLPERAGLATPPPPGPGTGPARASGFSGRQRGRGGLAGLQGWAGGFPLWASVPPGSLPNARQVEECRAPPPHSFLASPPPSPRSRHAARPRLRLCLRQSPPLPGLPALRSSRFGPRWPLGLCTGCAPVPGALPQMPLWPPCFLQASISKATSLGPPSLLGLQCPPPHPSPHPALLCFYSLNRELPASGSPARCTHSAGSPPGPQVKLTSPAHHGPPSCPQGTH